MEVEELLATGTGELAWLMLKSVEPPTTLEFHGPMEPFILA